MDFNKMQLIGFGLGAAAVLQLATPVTIAGLLFLAVTAVAWKLIPFNLFLKIPAVLIAAIFLTPALGTGFNLEAALNAINIPEVDVPLIEVEGNQITGD